MGLRELLARSQRQRGVSTGTAPAPASDRLLILQVGRGLAALAVALFHARLGTAEFVAPLPQRVAATLAHGMLGVDFFFVLSGFIIFHAHGSDAPGLRTLRSYAAKRLSRIYIPYLPICAVVIVSYLALPGLSRVDRDWGWWTSVLLVPSDKPPALVVAWTLVYELMFYVIFALFYASRRIFAVIVVCWMVAILLRPQAVGVFAPWVATLTNPINFEFLFGMASALAYRNLLAGQRTLPFALGLLAAGAVIMVGYFVAIAGEGPERLVFGAGGSLALLGAALIEPRLKNRIPTPLVALGDASYAIYLIHNPLISLTSRVAARLAVLNSWAMSLGFSLLCVVAAGWLYHVLFEKPALAAVRKLMRAPAPTSSPVRRADMRPTVHEEV